MNEATINNYKNNGIKEYEFMAFLDKKTSPQCRELDGKIFSVEEYIVDDESNMNGIVDIVIKNSKNELIIFDYKTGKPRNIDKYKLELCVYKILLESKYPELNVVSAGIYFTSSAAYRIANFGSRSGDYFKSQSKGDIDGGDFDYVEKIVDNLYDTIDRNYYKKERGYLCRYCFYKESCRLAW